MTKHGDRRWNGTYVPIDINPFITHPAHERLYHTTGVYALYSWRTAVWVVLRHTRIVKELWDGSYGFASLSERARISNHLFMSQERQHILLTVYHYICIILLFHSPCVALRKKDDCSRSTQSIAFMSNAARNRQDKSLRHVAMVAKLLDDNKPKKSLKSLFALFQTSPILFNFI